MRKQNFTDAAFVAALVTASFFALDVHTVTTQTSVTCSQATTPLDPSKTEAAEYYVTDGEACYNFRVCLFTGKCKSESQSDDTGNADDDPNQNTTETINTGTDYSALPFDPTDFGNLYPSQPTDYSDYYSPQAQPTQMDSGLEGQTLDSRMIEGSAPPAAYYTGSDPLISQDELGRLLNGELTDAEKAALFPNSRIANEQPVQPATNNNELSAYDQYDLGSEDDNPDYSSPAKAAAAEDAYTRLISAEATKSELQNELDNSNWFVRQYRSLFPSEEMQQAEADIRQANRDLTLAGISEDTLVFDADNRNVAQYPNTLIDKNTPVAVIQDGEIVQTGTLSRERQTIGMVQPLDQAIEQLNAEAGYTEGRAYAADVSYEQMISHLNPENNQPNNSDLPQGSLAGNDTSIPADYVSEQLTEYTSNNPTPNDGICGPGEPCSVGPSGQSNDQSAYTAAQLANLSEEERQLLKERQSAEYAPNFEGAAPVFCASGTNACVDSGTIVPTEDGPKTLGEVLRDGAKVKAEIDKALADKIYGKHPDEQAAIIADEIRTRLEAQNISPTERAYLESLLESSNADRLTTIGQENKILSQLEQDIYNRAGSHQMTAPELEQLAKLGGATEGIPVNTQYQQFPSNDYANPDNWKNNYKGEITLGSFADAASRYTGTDELAILSNSPAGNLRGEGTPFGTTVSGNGSQLVEPVADTNPQLTSGPYPLQSGGQFDNSTQPGQAPNSITSIDASNFDGDTGAGVTSQKSVAQNGGAGFGGFVDRVITTVQRTFGINPDNGTLIPSNSGQTSIPVASNGTAPSPTTVSPSAPESQASGNWIARNIFGWTPDAPTLATNNSSVQPIDRGSELSTPPTQSTFETILDALNPISSAVAQPTARCRANNCGGHKYTGVAMDTIRQVLSSAGSSVGAVKPRNETYATYETLAHWLAADVIKRQAYILQGVSGQKLDTLRKQESAWCRSDGDHKCITADREAALLKAGIPKSEFDKTIDPGDTDTLMKLGIANACAEYSQCDPKLFSQAVKDQALAILQRPETKQILEAAGLSGNFTNPATSNMRVAAAPTATPSASDEAPKKTTFNTGNVAIDQMLEQLGEYKLGRANTTQPDLSPKDAATLPKDEQLKLRVYDSAGQFISTLGDYANTIQNDGQTTLENEARAKQLNTKFGAGHEVTVSGSTRSVTKNSTPAGSIDTLTRENAIIKALADRAGIKTTIQDGRVYDENNSLLALKTKTETAYKDNTVKLVENLRGQKLVSLHNPDTAPRFPTTDQWITDLKEQGIKVEDLRGRYDHYATRNDTKVDTRFMHGDKGSSEFLMRHCRTTRICYNAIVAEDGSVIVLAGDNKGGAHARGGNTMSRGFVIARADSDGRERNNATAAQVETAKKIAALDINKYGLKFTAHGISPDFSKGGRHRCEGGCNTVEAIFGSLDPNSANFGKGDNLAQAIDQTQYALYRTNRGLPTEQIGEWTKASEVTTNMPSTGTVTTYTDATGNATVLEDVKPGTFSVAPNTSSDGQLGLTYQYTPPSEPAADPPTRQVKPSPETTTRRAHEALKEIFGIGAYTTSPLTQYISNSDNIFVKLYKTIAYAFGFGPAGEATETQTFIGGQWVNYLDESAKPGEATLFRAEEYRSPFTLTGEAHGAWFSDRRAPARVYAPDNTVLWEGLAFATTDYVYDMMVPYSVYVDVGDYTGTATFVLYPGDRTDEPDETATTSFDVIAATAEQTYSATIKIVR